MDRDEEFDFVEVRQRRGHRVDNRYKILDNSTSPIPKLGQIIRDVLSDDDETSWKLVYAGMVHAFPWRSKDALPPPPQLWHRDGPSLFAEHHATHCFNVFVPLVDVNVDNGAQLDCV